MDLHWTAATSYSGLGPYADWEAAVEAAEGGPPRRVPLFVRLVDPGDGTDLVAALAQALTLPFVDFAAHERDLLETERLHAGPGWPHEVRFVAFVARSDLDRLPAAWVVLAAGPGFVPAEPMARFAPCDLCATRGRLDPAVPVLAILDDGIGYLNVRFRAGLDRTRVLGVWLQAAERRAQGPLAPSRDIRMGRVLTAAEIDAQLASGLPEADLYRQANRALYPRTERAATDRRVTHGTHVLDLAAGARFAEPMAAVPILAVQLPPASIRESAGRRMAAHLVQGLRWCLAELLRQSDGIAVPPLVVNLSLGSLGGPGDASEFLAEWLAYEVSRHARLAPGAEVRVTGAYGNARLSRLVARAELRIDRPLRLDWRVLPDDRTSSFLELRVESTLARGLRLRLTPPPAAGRPPLTIDWPGVSGQGWRLDTPHGPLAAVQAVPEASGQLLLHLALAPTVAFGGLAVAPPGRWQVDIATTENEPVLLTAKVQRDDTPFGHPPFGRQSWLDHPEGWVWEAQSHSYTAPRAGSGGADCPVTREGTHVAFGGADDPGVVLVGAARPVPGQPAASRPSLYAAEGVVQLRRPGESLGPALAARGDDGAVLTGVRAAGTLTGSQARLAGSSMAAPAVARRLLDYFRTVPQGRRTPAAERAALLGPAPAASPPVDPQLGAGVLAGT
ncbi:hypothetical protein LHP98_06690 [Rhodobacter sp. Har01]|uniref:hypothetical protein n=1 Tax=Rhodobacter sp. Har01 TaxID=2883999 RepID=UPI001D0924AF|nr:hypothetical protein [Rhodobacter sp. Har01]MCB6177818.1 hypothetical protein [Rhodobacter sp. Har01]